MPVQKTTTVRIRALLYSHHELVVIISEVIGKFSETNEISFKGHFCENQTKDITTKISPCVEVTKLNLIMSVNRWSLKFNPKSARHIDVKFM